MEPQKSPFNRVLLVVLVTLYLLTIAAYGYANMLTDPQYKQWWMTTLNILILSIPLLLLYGSIYVVVTAWREYTATGTVEPRRAKIIHWAPRLAAILIILFISLFSLDVFDMEAPPLELLGGFLMHNIPSIIMLVLLIFAWKRPAVGFWAFLTAGVLFALFFVRSIYSLSNLVLFVFPILLVAGLFYADWKWLAQPSAAV